MKRFFLLFLLIASVALIFSDEIDEVRELLAKEKGGDILYLSKINLGIPGGDNWVANRSDDRWTYIYTINNDKEVKLVDGISITELSNVRYWVRTDTYDNLEYDIMQNIPGTRLGSKAAKFGDYNGDGKDEIFVIHPYDDSRCFIFGYNNDNVKKEYYLYNRFIISDPKGPIPIIFTNYQGLDGILIYSRTFEGQNVWYFFVLNEGDKKYVRLMEIGTDELDYSMFPLVKPKEKGYNEPAAVESVVTGNEIELYEKENAFEETSASTPVNSGKSTKSILYIAITAVIAVLAAAVVFIVLRMKKKKP